MKVPGTVCEYKSGCFSPFLAPSKMNLELLMGRGAASPHLKPLSGLANLFAHVSPHALSPQMQNPVGKMANSMGVRLRRVLHLFCKPGSLHSQS